jgi:cell division protein FtsW
LFGRGFGESTEKMFYLPEAHTDFIFSIIGEEWGFIGTSIIIFLFLVILFRGLKIAVHVKDRFSFYLVVGITAHFSIYAIFHMMVTLGLAPPTGLPLPFISYGGTSMVGKSCQEPACSKTKTPEINESKNLNCWRRNRGTCLSGYCNN